MRINDIYIYNRDISQSLFGTEEILCEMRVKAAMEMIPNEELYLNWIKRG